MKRATDSPSSIELTPRNVGILLATTGLVIAVSFGLGSRMSAGLAASAGAHTGETPDEGRPALPPQESPPPPTQGSDGEELSRAAQDVLREIRGVEDPAGEIAAEPPPPPLEEIEPLAAIEALPEATAQVIEPPAPRPTPAVTMAQARPSPPETSARPAVRPGGFTVQIEAGRSRQSAEKRAAALETAGWPAFVQRADLGARGIYYRVRVGRFETRDEAKRTLTRLAASEGKSPGAYVVMANN